MNNQKGISLVRVLIIVIVVGVVLVGVSLFINTERAQTRDAKRLSDISRLQAAFALLYSDTASYTKAADNGCQRGMLASQCNLKDYIPSIVQFKDPGKYRYLVAKTPAEDSYEITFTLEQKYQNVAAGKHTLSQTGIK